MQGRLFTSALIAPPESLEHFLFRGTTADVQSEVLAQQNRTHEAAVIEPFRIFHRIKLHGGF